MPRAVLEQARDLDAELIVLGSRQHSWPSALFEFSVSDEVSRHAKCATLLVR
jgi:nucleotide-binding universal stress UspA family protein